MGKFRLTEFIIIASFCSVAFCLVQQYFYIATKVNWDYAFAYCLLNSYQLSSVSSQDEMNALLQISSSAAWIGLRRDKNGVWRWMNGQSLNFQSWLLNMPNLLVGQDDCAMLDSNGWSSVDCRNSLPFFCTGHAQPMYVVQQNVTWEEALYYCRQMYADLVTLNSLQELQMALHKTQGLPGNYWWTGLRFLAGSWFWLSGKSVVNGSWSQKPLPQCPSAPYQCGALNPQNQKQENVSCTELHGFICY